MHKGSISPHPYQHLLLWFYFVCCCCFKIVTILMSMKWYIIVVSICISQVISDVEHLSIFWLAIWVSPFGEMPIHPFARFKIG